MTVIQPGQTAPDFSLLDLKGQDYQLSARPGKPVLLNFFSTSCSWCQVELPKLAEIYRRLDDVDVQILGVAVGDEDVTRITEFAREKQLDFPIVIDADGQARQAYNLERVPTLVLIGADGEVQRVYQGSSEQLTGIVEQTILAAARGDRLPDFSLIGNGCSPDA